MYSRPNGERIERKEWKKFSIEKCAEMMDEIPYRLQLVIENNGEQIYKY